MFRRCSQVVAVLFSCPLLDVHDDPRSYALFPSATESSSSLPLTVLVILRSYFGELVFLSILHVSCAFRFNHRLLVSARKMCMMIATVIWLFPSATESSSSLPLTVLVILRSYFGGQFIGGFSPFYTSRAPSGSIIGSSYSFLRKTSDVPMSGLRAVGMSSFVCGHCHQTFGFVFGFLLLPSSSFFLLGVFWSNFAYAALAALI